MIDDLSPASRWISEQVHVRATGLGPHLHADLEQTRLVANVHGDAGSNISCSILMWLLRVPQRLGALSSASYC